MDISFKLFITEEFQKIASKQCKKTPGLKNKLEMAFEKLKINPHSNEKVQDSKHGERRIWVGDSHRLFYLTDGNQIIPTNLRKKDKSTYR